MAFTHGIQMIVGKCSNPPTDYGATDRRQETVAPTGLHADNDAASVRALVSQEKFRPKAEAALNRHDPSFVTHLIATAEQVPQTRALRRASVEDAMSYYDAMSKVASSASRVVATGSARVV